MTVPQHMAHYEYMYAEYVYFNVIFGLILSRSCVAVFFFSIEHQ